MTGKDRKTDPIEIIQSSGNVYADLGFAEPELEMAKAKLAGAISQTIEDRKLTQLEAAELSGLDQPKISAIQRGRLGGFSIERLFRTLNALGRDIEIIVRESAENHDSQLAVRVESAPA